MVPDLLDLSLLKRGTDHTHEVGADSDQVSSIHTLNQPPGRRPSSPMIDQVYPGESMPLEEDHKHPGVILQGPEVLLNCLTQKGPSCLRMGNALSARKRDTTAETVPLGKQLRQQEVAHLDQ